MTNREKTMAGIVGAVVGGVVLYGAVSGLYLSPREQAERDIVNRTNDMAKLKRQNQADQAVASRTIGIAARTFDGDEARAAAQLGATLAALVERAGLNARKLSLQPVTGMHVRGVYKEIGRSIGVRGKLANLVDFLYLLRQQPHLHRLDSISIGPIPRSDEMDLQARYSTLIIEGEGVAKLPIGKATTQVAAVDLDSDERRLLDSIAARDIFRPYIQRRAETIAVRPPPAEADAGPRISVAPRPVEAAKPPTRFKLVGLPRWDDRQEAIVSDGGSGQVRVYKPGDEVAGGKLLAVDYRPIPSPKNEHMTSPSRAIIQIGPDLWAVELGQDLSEKRRLKAEQFPPGVTTHPVSEK
jgi:hypothetical protein